MNGTRWVWILALLAIMLLVGAVGVWLYWQKDHEITHLGNKSATRNIPKDTERVKGKRLALVIGNSAYQQTSTLPNPIKDAKAVAQALAALGFEVDGPYYDLNRAQMNKHIRQFGRRARSAVAAVVYYAGHGIESGGDNYLIPVDAELADEAEIDSDAIALHQVLKQIHGQRGWRLIILDACRDNPLANKMARLDGTRSVFRGLEPIEPDHQTYVAYAAKAGSKALDQDPAGSSNSPFVAALLEHLTGSRPLPELFGAIREDVLKRTDQRQEPWLYGAFGSKPICLVRCAYGSEENKIELRHWDSTEKCGTAACYREYLRKYPQGEFAGLAKERLKETVPSPQMIRIKGGHFQIGNPQGNREQGGSPISPNSIQWEGGQDNHQQRYLYVAPFELGKYEVTVGEFRRFVEATGYTTDAERNAGRKEGCYIAYRNNNDKWTYGYRQDYDWRNPNFSQNDSYPVVCISWNDAMAYTRWLSERTGKTYRLPTEAEWEYAARAGKTSSRYWKQDTAACRHANVYDRTAKQRYGFSWAAYNCEDGHAQTAPAGQFQANAWGLKDMLGNVWEWTCSEYSGDYGGNEQGCIRNRTNPDKHRALRGGAWNDRPDWVQSTLRYRLPPTDRNDGTGFRLARSFQGG